MMDKNHDRTLTCSCATFDSMGRLLDWNTDFEAEFSLAGTGLTSGTPFREILQQAYTEDRVIRIHLPSPNQANDALHYMERWPQDLESSCVFKYWDNGSFINVREYRTVSNGVIRIAETQTMDIPVPADEASGSTPSTIDPTETPVYADDEQDRLLRAAALETSNSILLLRLRNEQKLKSLSVTDGLTGLANRRHFNETLESKWHQALQAKKPLGIAIVDVDHFKKYNDYYGHSAGDTCLRQVAATLSESMRQGMDLVARYGGEEFAIILPGTEPTAAKAAAERACSAVAAMNEPHIHGVDGIVTVSIGVAALIPSTGMAAQQLLDQADAALYEAKEQGRNRTVASSVGS